MASSLSRQLPLRLIPCRIPFEQQSQGEIVKEAERLLERLGILAVADYDIRKVFGRQFKLTIIQIQLMSEKIFISKIFFRYSMRPSFFIFPNSFDSALRSRFK